MRELLECLLGISLFGRNPRKGNLTIRKFLTPTSAKLLVQDVIMIHALIKL